MKVKAKTAFFNGNTLYKKGDELEVKAVAFDPILMEEIPEEKAPAKKTTKKKS